MANIAYRNPADIDGSTAQVATEAIAEATRVIYEVCRYLDEVETQVRNAVMQVAVEKHPDVDPYKFWESSKEFRVTDSIATQSRRLSSTLALLAKVGLADGVLSNAAPPRVGEDVGSGRPSGRADRVGGAE